MPGPRYKWVTLVLAFFIMFFLSAIEYLVPFLLGPMMKDLRLTYTEGGLVFGTLFLGLIFFGPVGGVVIDRFGVRKTVGLATAIEVCVCAIEGIFNRFLRSLPVFSNRFYLHRHPGCRCRAIYFRMVRARRTRQGEWFLECRVQA